MNKPKPAEVDHLHVRLPLDVGKLLRNGAAKNHRLLVQELTVIIIEHYKGKA